MAVQAPGVLTLRQIDSSYPPGTKVAAYPRSAVHPGLRPTGEPLGHATVRDDGTLTFRGLPDERLLTLYAVVDGQPVKLDTSTHYRHPERAGAWQMTGVPHLDTIGVR